MTRKFLPEAVFQAPLRFLFPGHIHSFQRAGQRGGWARGKSALERGALGSGGGLLPSRFSPQLSQAPGQALATLTSRNNILASDSRWGLQHPCHIAFSGPSTGTPQLPPPWASEARLWVLPVLLPWSPRCRCSLPTHNGQTGPGRPSQTPLILQGGSLSVDITNRLSCLWSRVSVPIGPPPCFVMPRARMEAGAPQFPHLSSGATAAARAWWRTLARGSSQSPL